MSDILFTETNNMLYGWNKALFMLAALALEAFAIYCHLCQEGNPGLYVDAYALAAITALAAFIALIAVFLKSKVTVTGGQVSIRTVPTRIIPAEDIAGCDVEDVKPVRQFGGWGTRWTFRKRGYVIAGLNGVRIRQAGGPDIVICSRRPEELKKAIDSMRKAS